MKKCKLVMLASVTAVAIGCARSPDSTKEFVLPAGDAVAGEAAFLARRCYDCHTLGGVKLPLPEQIDQVLVALGGEKSRVTTYGDLLTAIVNPSHRLAPGYTEELVAVDGASKMTSYNDVMTVTELIDIVTYLQPKYRIRKPDPPSRYPQYGYPY